MFLYIIQALNITFPLKLFNFEIPFLYKVICTAIFHIGSLYPFL